MKVPYLIMCAIAAMLFASCGTVQNSAVGTIGTKVASRSAPSAKQTKETVVRRGMTQDQVIEIMGRPRSKSNHNGTEMWVYHGNDVNYPGGAFVALATGIQSSMTMITFSGSGRVSKVDSHSRSSQFQLFGSVDMRSTDPSLRFRRIPWERVALCA